MNLVCSTTQTITKYKELFDIVATPNRKQCRRLYYRRPCAWWLHWRALGAGRDFTCCRLVFKVPQAAGVYSNQVQWLRIAESTAWLK